MIRHRLFLLLLAALLFAGCGKKIDVVPAKGKVLIDGEPAANIVIMFTPKITEEGVPAVTSQATTNENGEFELYTVENKPGAMPGPHMVSLVDGEMERSAQGADDESSSRLNAMYDTQRIEVTITEGQDITIEAKGPEAE